MRPFCYGALPYIASLEVIYFAPVQPEVVVRGFRKSYFRASVLRVASFAIVPKKHHAER